MEMNTSPETTRVGDCGSVNSSAVEVLWREKYDYVEYLQVAGSRDEEPLVDRGVDGGSRLGSRGREVLDNIVLSSDQVGALLDRDVAPTKKKT